MLKKNFDVYEPKSDEKRKKLKEKVPFIQKEADAFSFRVAGMHHYVKGIFEIKKLLNNLKAGMTVRIEHEVTNKFDSYACEVFFGDTKIGYVPKVYNEEIINLAKQGKNFIFMIEESVELGDYFESYSRPEILVICT